jgi:hypothetical protein
MTRSGSIGTLVLGAALVVGAGSAAAAPMCDLAAITSAAKLDETLSRRAVEDARWRS